MATRSITDREIALIKGMLARGMKNNDIQFVFNRPERPVNSGRITGIRNGHYGNSKTIPAATAAEVNEFLKSQAEMSAAPPSSKLDASPDPLSDDTLRALFERDKGKRWRLANGETDAHECKANFGLKYPGGWLRAIAALANNAGGYVFFGVHDKSIGDGGDDLSHVAVGMKSDEFARIDPAEITKRVKAVFDPTPRFRTKTLELDGATIGVIHVEQHDSRPVIAVRSEGTDIREGEIYFRYSGQSTRIKYSDLRAILDARDREARSMILPMVERLLRQGPEKSMIVDLQDGTLDDGRTSIQIDAGLIDKLVFIKEGEFSEMAGAPTLRLIGDVTTNGGPSAIQTKRDVVTRDDIFSAFLDRTSPPNPESYIRFAVAVSQGEWFPLHYLAALARMTNDDLIDCINATAGSKARKATYVARVAPNAAYKEAIGTPKAVLSRIIAHEPVQLTNANEASQVAQAIQALPRDQPVDQDEMLPMLKRCLMLLVDHPAQSHARRAISRVDELLYGYQARPARGPLDRLPASIRAAIARVKKGAN